MTQRTCPVWLLSIGAFLLASALSVRGMYLLGRNLYNHDVGVLAAALGGD